MTTDRFRSVALALRDYVNDTYNLLAATDAVVALDPAPANPTRDYLNYPPALLVAAVKGSPEVMAELVASRKINAIKALRNLSSVNGLSTISLKDAKDTVENAGLVSYVASLRDPWADYEETDPPF